MAVVDTFGTFLETREALRHGARQQLAPDPAIGPLELLQWGEFPTTPEALRRQTPFSPGQLTDALRRLTEADLVTIVQRDSGSVVALTAKGEALRTR